MLCPGQTEVIIDRTVVEHTIPVYGQARAEPDSDLRSWLMAQARAKDVHGRDSGIDLKGVDALARHRGEFRDKFPQGADHALCNFDYFGPVFRAASQLYFNRGVPPDLDGFDCGEWEADGRLVSLGSLLRGEETLRAGRIS